MSLAWGLNAATYYVATTGNDSSSGTSSQPFRTLQRGVNAAGPGDTIVVRDGTYYGGCSSTGSYAVTINKAGSSSAWITLKAENKRKVTLDAQNACHSFINLGSSAAYWVIQDFRVINGWGGGIWSNSGADYITLRGNEIAYIGRMYRDSTIGIVGSYANASSHHLTYDGNAFHDIGRTGGPQVAHDHGLYIHSQDTTIVNNVFYQPITGWGIQTASGFSGLIANNSFLGPHPVKTGQIQLWESNGSVTIRNNIFHTPRTSAIGYYDFSPASCTIDNNIVYGSGVSLGGPSSCSTSNNRLNTDPMLVNSTTAPYDFHLRSGSPAINTGVTVTAAPTDFNGVTRPQGAAYDVGVCEYASSTTSASAPIISAVTASSVTYNSAGITWVTDKPSNSQVQYGTSSLTSATPIDATMVTNHSVLLSSLTASTTYRYKVISKDADGLTSQSSEYTFTTAAAPLEPSPPPTSSTAGASYYVATTGSDSNPGTLSQPFRTLQQGVNSAQAGDTVIVRDGTYTGGCSSNSSFPVVINKAGASGAWITLKAENKWRATLDSQNVCHSFISLGSSAAYWVIQDFRVINGWGGGIWSNSGADYITLRGNEIAYIGRHYQNSSIGIPGSYANSSSHHLTFDGNVFHDIGRTGGPQTAHDHGLYLQSQNNTIVNNVFYQPIVGWGIQTGSGFSGLIANNTFHGPHASREGHIMLWDPNGSVTVRNNIFYAPRTQAITQYTFSATSCTIDNNIVYGSGVSLGAPSICSTSYNRLNTDPMLANATSAPYSFHLTADSPAIDTGATVTAAATDFDGITRPQGSSYDVGACEYASQLTAASAPIISAVAASAVTYNSASITWVTDKQSDSQVQYGTSSLTSATSVDPTMVTNHSVLLSSLAASTTYRYKVVSKDATGLSSQSSEYSFTTPAAPVQFGFSVSASPTTASVEKGGSVNIAITATLLSGTSQSVIFSAPNLPSGVTATFSPPGCTVTCSTTLSLWVSSAAASGTSAIPVSATNGSTASSTTISLTVNDQPTINWDLAAYWAFDERRGTVAGDSSANNNDGTLVGSTRWYEGDTVRAIRFRYAGDHVAVNEHPSLGMTSELTVAFWIRAEDVRNVDERVIAKSYSWDVKLNGAYRYPQFSSGGSYAKLNYTLPTGYWRHVAFTFSSGVVKGYINGSPVSFAAVTSFPTKLPLEYQGLVIGTDAGKSMSMKGLLDEVRMYGRALSAEEIKQVYMLSLR